MDQAAAGANVGTFVEASRVSVFVPEFHVPVALFAFNSVDEIARFVESDTFAAWNEALREKSGLTLLSFNWYQGARQMLTKKPIATPGCFRSSCWRASASACSPRPRPVPQSCSTPS